MTEILGAPIEIWTDGGCDPNPGPGGWGVVWKAGGKIVERHGSALVTTNNRMELTAAIRGLHGLKRTCTNVKLHTDSQYVVRGITQWVSGWEARGWKRKGGGAVLNVDLWQELRRLTKIHHVKFIWVKGHAGNALNERADQLATRGVQEARAALRHASAAL